MSALRVGARHAFCFSGTRIHHAETEKDDMTRKPINEQIVAVVGAASGIGRETARQFAERGARLVVADNDEEGLQTLVDEIQRAGGQVISITADVSNFTQVTAIASLAEQEYGRLDTWAHIAGVGVYATFAETTPEEFRRVLDVNLMGEVHGAKASIPLLAREGGTLICISSVEARRSLPLHSAYAASKHGVDGFLEALRVELLHDRVPVTVTQILPATINTPFFDKARTKMGVKPLGLPPLYEPRVVANAILYAAEHPTRDLVVGGAGKMLLNTQRISPRLLDRVLAVVGFRGQKTSEPRSVDAPNNLFGPVQGDDRTTGDFGAFSMPASFSTWLDTHRLAKLGAMGAVVGTLLLRQTRRSRSSSRT
jgi:NAD(P)-dependent dehydrogenase (short-subunit alcohol dehydrogenase family)